MNYKVEKIRKTNFIAHDTQYVDLQVNYKIVDKFLKVKCFYSDSEQKLS